MRNNKMRNNKTKCLHIIIGGRNTRKSSLIRCLTGAGNTNPRKNLEIGLISKSNIEVNVRSPSLQEGDNPILPADFVTFVNTTNCDHFLFPLWVTGNKHGPNYKQYLLAFTSAKFDIVNIALLGSSAQGLSIPTSNSITSVPNPTSQPTNVTAAAVRSIWGWV